MYKNLQTRKACNSVSVCKQVYFVPQGMSYPIFCKVSSDFQEGGGTHNIKDQGNATCSCTIGQFFYDYVRSVLYQHDQHIADAKFQNMIATE